MKVLHIKIRGECYEVNLDGPGRCGDVMKRNDITFDEESRKDHQWQFIGVSYHHWRQGVDYHITPEVEPERLIKGLLWDVDHGTIRQWGGRYLTGLPRVESAWIEERADE